MKRYKLLIYPHVGGFVTSSDDIEELKQLAEENVDSDTFSATILDRETEKPILHKYDKEWEPHV